MIFNTLNMNSSNIATNKKMSKSTHDKCFSNCDLSKDTITFMSKIDKPTQKPTLQEKVEILRDQFLKNL